MGQAASSKQQALRNWDPGPGKKSRNEDVSDPITYKNLRFSFEGGVCLLALSFFQCLSALVSASSGSI